MSFFKELAEAARIDLVEAKDNPAEARKLWEEITDARRKVMHRFEEDGVLEFLSEADTISAEVRELF